MPALRSLAAAASLLLSPIALGHGSMKSPVSRVLAVRQANPERPTHPAHVQAVSNCGTQPFYDWHELSRVNGQYGAFLSNGGTPDAAVYREMIPDGRLVSAGRSKYACLDTPRGDWPATEMTAGGVRLEFDAHVVHEPSLFHVFITRSDHESSRALAWNDLIELDIDATTLSGNTYLIDTTLPPRTGRHVLYVIWQRVDPAGEAFFSTSDIVFGESGTLEPDPQDEGGEAGEGHGEHHGGPDNSTPPASHGEHCGADVTIELDVVDQWASGWTADLTCTLGAQVSPSSTWTVQWRGTPDIEQVWNASIQRTGDLTSLHNSSWNASVVPGGTIQVGFVGNGGWPPQPEHMMFNGLTADVWIDGEPWCTSDGGSEAPIDEVTVRPCDMDFDANYVVDHLDLIAMLANWGPCNGCPGDLDGDNMVAVSDVITMLAAFGPCSIVVDTAPGDDAGGEDPPVDDGDMHDEHGDTGAPPHDDQGLDGPLIPT